jgi:DNA-binding transcriptional LysR family regulator
MAGQRYRQHPFRHAVAARAERTERRVLRGRVQANQVSALHALCVEGWGICVAVRQEDFQALADGRLVPALPQWRQNPMPVYAVTPRRDAQPAKVRHTLDLLASYFDRVYPGVSAA